MNRRKNHAYPSQAAPVANRNPSVCGVSVNYQEVMTTRQYHPAATQTLNYTGNSFYSSGSQAPPYRNNYPTPPMFYPTFRGPPPQGNLTGPHPGQLGVPPPAQHGPCQQIPPMAIQPILIPGVNELSQGGGGSSTIQTKNHPSRRRKHASLIIDPNTGRNIVEDMEKETTGSKSSSNRETSQPDQIKIENHDIAVEFSKRVHKVASKDSSASTQLPHLSQCGIINGVTPSEPSSDLSYSQTSSEDEHSCLGTTWNNGISYSNLGDLSENSHYSPHQQLYYSRSVTSSCATNLGSKTVDLISEMDCSGDLPTHIRPFPSIMSVQPSTGTSPSNSLAKTEHTPFESQNSSAPSVLPEMYREPFSNFSRGPQQAGVRELSGNHGHLSPNMWIRKDENIPAAHAPTHFHSSSVEPIQDTNNSQNIEEKYSEVGSLTLGSTPVQSQGQSTSPSSALIDSKCEDGEIASTSKDKETPKEMWQPEPNGKTSAPATAGLLVQTAPASVSVGTVSIPPPPIQEVSAAAAATATSDPSIQTAHASVSVATVATLLPPVVQDAPVATATAIPVPLEQTTPVSAVTVTTPLPVQEAPVATATSSSVPSVQTGPVPVVTFSTPSVKEALVATATALSVPSVQTALVSVSEASVSTPPPPVFLDEPVATATATTPVPSEQLASVSVPTVSTPLPVQEAPDATATSTPVPSVQTASVSAVTVSTPPTVQEAPVATATAAPVPLAQTAPASLAAVSTPLPALVQEAHSVAAPNATPALSVQTAPDQVSVATGLTSPLSPVQEALSVGAAAAQPVLSAVASLDSESGETMEIRSRQARVESLLDLEGEMSLGESPVVTLAFSFALDKDSESSYSSAWVYNPVDCSPFSWKIELAGRDISVFCSPRSSFREQEYGGLYPYFCKLKLSIFAPGNLSGSLFSASPPLTRLQECKHERVTTYHLSDNTPNLLKNNFVASVELSVVTDLNILKRLKNNVDSPFEVENVGNGQFNEMQRLLWENRKFSDVCIVVKDGRKLAAHKLYLAEFSPVFHDLFAHEKGTDVVNLPDIPYEVANEMLRFLYVGSVETRDVLLLCQVIDLANQYNIGKLVIACENILLGILGDESLKESAAGPLILTTASRCNMKALKFASENVLVKTFNECEAFMYLRLSLECSSDFLLNFAAAVLIDVSHTELEDWESFRKDFPYTAKFLWMELKRRRWRVAALTV